MLSECIKKMRDATQGEQESINAYIDKISVNTGVNFYAKPVVKLWIDDVRKAPDGYVWLRSVNDTITYIKQNANVVSIELIDMDHDAGDFVCDGGDYIRILDWLETSNLCFNIRIHSQNPVGVQNMRAIIERNCWKELK